MCAVSLGKNVHRPIDFDQFEGMVYEYTERQDQIPVFDMDDPWCSEHKTHDFIEDYSKREGICSEILDNPPPGVCRRPMPWLTGLANPDERRHLPPEIDFTAMPDPTFDTSPQLTPNMETVAYGLFHEINKVREDPTKYGMGLTNIVAKKTASAFDEHPRHMYWNEGLARAARHIVNDQGACHLPGDAYGKNFEEVL